MKTDIVELIDRASKAAGSDNKLAKLIDATQPHISEWRSGKRTCPPADVALMAEIAGLNADEWALRAITWKYQGTPKGDKLLRALKVLAATGGAVLSSGVHAVTLAVTSPPAGDWIQAVLSTMYKMLRPRKAWQL